MMEIQMEDEEWGRVVIRVNNRAKRLIFRVKSDGVYVTVPPGTKLEVVKDSLDTLRDKLHAAQERVVPSVCIDCNYAIQTDLLQLTFHPEAVTRFGVRSREGVVQIIYPISTNWADEALQSWLQKVILESLRKQARCILPYRLETLSRRCNLPYASVKINSSKGRWGSCSGTKNINLSLYLMRLPSHLVDYVLLHELCHTQEMNHGERFWALLNRFTNGKAKELRSELSLYRAEI